MYMEVETLTGGAPKVKQSRKNFQILYSEGRRVPAPFTTQKAPRVH